MKIEVNFKKKPTQKMIDYAEILNEETVVKMPPEAYEDFDVCSDYISRAKYYRENYGADNEDDLDEFERQWNEGLQ